MSSQVTFEKEEIDLKCSAYVIFMFIDQLKKAKTEDEKIVLMTEMENEFPLAAEAYRTKHETFDEFACNLDFRRIDPTIQLQLKEVYEQLNNANLKSDSEKQKTVIEEMKKKPFLKDLFNLNECEHFLEQLGKRPEKDPYWKASPYREYYIEKTADDSNYKSDDLYEAMEVDLTFDQFELWIEKDYKELQPTLSQENNKTESGSYDSFLKEFCDGFWRILEKQRMKTESVYLPVLKNANFVHMAILMFYYSRLRNAKTSEDREKVFADMNKSPDIVKLFLQNEVAQFRVNNPWLASSALQSHLNFYHGSLRREQGFQSFFQEMTPEREIYEMIDKRLFAISKVEEEETWRERMRRAVGGNEKTPELNFVMVQVENCKLEDASA